MVKNDRAVLCSDVRALAVQRHWVVVRPKNVKKLLVTDLGWIEFDLNDFRVASLVGADIFVTRIFFRPAGVTDGSRGHALQSAKSFLDPPETARSKGRFFHCHAK